MAALTLATLTAPDLRLYGRIDEESDEMLDALLEAARAFCLSYTGLRPDEAEKYPDIAVAALVVAADLYDTRSMTVERDTVNPTVRAILDLHGGRNTI